MSPTFALLRTIVQLQQKNRGQWLVRVHLQERKNDGIQGMNGRVVPLPNVGSYRKRPHPNSMHLHTHDLQLELPCFM